MVFSNRSREALSVLRVANYGLVIGAIAPVSDPRNRAARMNIRRYLSNQRKSGNSLEMHVFCKQL